LIYEEEITVLGRQCRIEIYLQQAGKYFAITRFTESDAFICDGFSVDEVLAKHRGAIPLALGCRIASPKRMGSLSAVA